ncbi:hypothetical protein [Dankookia sp. P2]|uniref:hypothetical protein n=1 Tax=Dankookia sp. P2 TaxID=3423955 RepID=UPI003D676657
MVVDITSPRERWASLGDGYRVDARIAVATVEDAVLAPAGALFRKGDGWAAFLVREGVAREARVAVARRSPRLVAVAAGLAPGDQVVLFPPSALRDGARVRSVR